MVKKSNNFIVGDKVKLPQFNEKGVIIALTNALWGFKYVVKLTDYNPVMHDENEVVEARGEDMILLPRIKTTKI